MALVALIGVGCGGSDRQTPPTRTEHRQPRSAERSTGDRVSFALAADGSVALDVVFVPPGEFSMGEDREGAFDQKPHAVRVTKSFFLGAGPVSVGQFRRFTQETGYRTTAEKDGSAFACATSGCRFVRGVSWRAPGFDQEDDHPVVVVGWEDAAAFADWARRKTGKPFRLPTEAEWEWAARGPSSESVPSRRDAGGSRGNLLDLAAKGAGPSRDVRFSSENDGYAFTSPVGRFDNPSWVGATDMLGNVWEWCSDWYERNYYATAPRDDPRGPLTGVYHVLRGCSWMSSRDDCGLSSRGWFEPLLRANTRGFRVAVDGDALAGAEAGT